MKKTLILGASKNPERYSNIAAYKLVSHGHPIVNVGLKSGEVAGVAIELPEIIHDDIDTITLYLGPANQIPFYEYILNSKPNRIIFNPGTENVELENLAEEHGIETTEACTLVLLSTGQY